MDNKQNRPLPEQIAREFDEADIGDIREIWQHTSSLGGDNPDQHVDEALSDLQLRLEMSGEITSKPDRIAGWIQHHSRLLVAAVALIATTTIFVLVPKTVSISYGEMATVELPDGTTIEMNSGSAIRYSRLYRFTNRTVELNGEAYFSVINHAHPFIVETNGAAIEVTGTSFNVRSWANDPENNVSVTVTEGEVKFFPYQFPDNPVLLSAGESSHWNRLEQRPTDPEPAVTEDIAAWRENRFVFRDQTLSSILRDLERRYDVTIELEADHLASSTLTAYYSQQVPIESVLDDISVVKGLRYTPTTTGYRIYQ